MAHILVLIMPNYSPMNRLLLPFLIACSLSGMAQQKFEEDTEHTFRFGAKAGVNINKLQAKAFSDAFSYNYVLGGFIQWNFSRRFGLQPEVNFSQASSEVTDDNTDIYDDLFLGGEQKKATLNYLKIPLLLNIDIGQSQRVKLQVGPQWSQLLKSQVDSLRNPNQSIFKKGDFAMVGGLWIQIPFVNLGARFEQGLTNISEVGTREKWHHQGFLIFAGITF